VLSHVPKLKILGSYFKEKEGKNKEKATKREKRNKRVPKKMKNEKERGK